LMAVIGVPQSLIFEGRQTNRGRGGVEVVCSAAATALGNLVLTRYCIMLCIASDTVGAWRENGPSDQPVATSLSRSCGEAF
jgi:hypothetical protein